MRRLLGVVIVSAAAAVLLAAVFGAGPSWLNTLLAVLAGWTAVSVAATAFVVATMRATAHANADMAHAERPAEFTGRLAHTHR